MRWGGSNIAATATTTTTSKRGKSFWENKKKKYATGVCQGNLSLAEKSRWIWWNYELWHIILMSESPCKTSRSVHIY